MKNKKVFLSIVIPVYNEEERIHNIKLILNFLKKKKFIWEIILVNDGSSDSTLKKIKKYQINEKINLISYKENRGKGFAIRKGMLASRGKYLLFLDIDLSTPIKEIDKFLPVLKKFPVVIGSRKIKGAKVLIHQQLLRETFGRMFTKMSQISTDVSVSDFTCGFKSFEKSAARKIFYKSKIDRWGFDAEILFLAKKFRYKIKEMPVNWKMMQEQK